MDSTQSVNQELNELNSFEDRTIYVHGKLIIIHKYSTVRVSRQWDNTPIKSKETNIIIRYPVAIENGGKVSCNPPLVFP
jgi:hypothetical protein